MLKLFFAILYLVLTYTVIAQSTQTPKPILKLGAVLALSGPASAWGEYARLGIEMAIAEANESSRDHREIKLLIEDSQSNPRDALSAFKKLTQFEGVRVVVGDVWSQLTNVMMPISKSDKIILLSPSVVAASVDSPSEYFFTMGPKIELAKNALIKFFDLRPTIKQVALFCWDNPWGNSYTKIWEEALQQKNIKIVFRSCNPNDFAYDYRTDVAKAVRAMPDAFLIAHDSEKILKLLAEFNYHRPVLSTSNIVEVFTNGMLPKTLSDEIYFTDWPPNQEFQRAFEKRYAKQAILEAHDAYEITRSALRAFEISAPGLDFLGALRKISYLGVSGRIDFSRSFSVNYASASLMRIRNGHIEQVE